MGKGVRSRKVRGNRKYTRRKIIRRRTKRKIIRKITKRKIIRRRTKRKTRMKGGVRSDPGGGAVLDGGAILQGRQRAAHGEAATGRLTRIPSESKLM